MPDERVPPAAVVVGAIPYFALGYPWFATFRDAWFEGGGLTAQQLIEGPGYATAFSAAIVASLVMSWTLAWLVARTGERSVLRGVKIAGMVWLAFVAAVLGTQYVFEGRPLVYFLITAGHPLVALLITGAIVGGWTSPRSGDPRAR